MKKLMTLCVMAVILGLQLGCSGADDAGVDPSVSISTLDFEGDYSLRDDSCSYPLPAEIRIVELDRYNISMTVINPGSTSMEQGDIFYAGIQQDDSAYFNLYGCTIVRVASTRFAENVENQTTVIHRRGDIGGACLDPDSSDDSCFFSYRPE